MNLPESNRDMARRLIQEHHRAKIARLMGMSRAPGELEQVRNIAERMHAMVANLEEYRRNMEEADRIRAHALGVRL